MKIDPTIPGWTNDWKLTTFAKLAHHLEVRDEPTSILEIGVWCGRSMYAWAANAPSALVYAIDFGSDGYTLRELYQNKPEVFETLKGDIDAWDAWDVTVAQTRRKVASIHRLTNIRFQEISSQEFLLGNMQTFDIIFIDGDHSFEMVRQDLSAARHWIKPDGIILGDDYNWDTVRDAVHAVTDQYGGFLHVPPGKDLWMYHPKQDISSWLEEG